MNSFGGAGMGNAKEQFTSRCSPLVTANVEVIEELAEDLERYVICVDLTVHFLIAADNFCPYTPHCEFGEKLIVLFNFTYSW